MQKIIIVLLLSVFCLFFFHRCFCSFFDRVRIGVSPVYFVFDYGSSRSIISQYFCCVFLLCVFS